MIPDFDEAMTGITKEMVPDPELRALYQQLVRLRNADKFSIDDLNTDSHIPGGKIFKKIGRKICGWMFRELALQLTKYRIQQEEMIYYMLEYLRQHPTEALSGTSAEASGQAERLKGEEA